MTALLLFVTASLAGTPTDTAADTGVGFAPTTLTTPTDTGTTPAPADTGLDLDRDGDGYTPNEGDCDDDAAEAHPGLVEVCNDRLDNDCDGLYDEACDDSVRFASLRGGGGCTDNSGLGTRAGFGPAALVLLLVPALRRRRR